MLEAFDPSAFIEAERAQVSQAVADNSYGSWAPIGLVKTAEIVRSATLPEPSVATIATIAADPLGNEEWVADLRAFVNTPCPAWMNDEIWDELTSEAWDVARNWSGKAVAAGWTSTDLFGCNPDPLARRVDRNGLVAAIVSLKTPVTIVAIDSGGATLRCSDSRSSAMRHRRQPSPGAVPLWEAYAVPDPP